MKKYIFWTAYAALVLILVGSGAYALDYVNNVLKQYEEAQPEKLVEAQLELIKKAAQEDTLEEIITFYELEQAEYDIDISDFREYKDKLKNAAELTYKMKHGYSETEQQFHILADGEKVAVLTMESIREEVKLAILTVNEWQLKSITPIMTLENYDYTVEVPKGFQVTINGMKLTNPAEAKEEGWETYEVETLYREPEIKLYDAYGAEAVFDIVENHVKPIVYTYSLRLPKGFTVSDNGRLQEGTADGEEVVYTFITLSKTLTLADAHGNTVEYKGGDSIYTYDYTVTLPDNFVMTVNGRSGADYLAETKDNRRYQYVEEYVDMPGIVTYKIQEALGEPEILIYDNLGRQIACEFEDYTFERREQTALDSIPEETAAQIDVLEVAKMWSLFMTDDLNGSQNGFGTIKEYLLKDSYLYQTAYKWATGIDITFMFGHTLENPPFTEEKVTNFISYGETVFSCDIYFIKHMRDRSNRNGEEAITDILNSTFYFMYYDETDDGKDNPHWVILDKQDILSE